MLRAAALRPINVTMLVIGVALRNHPGVVVVPLTLTYASLVFLAARDPIFQRNSAGARFQTSPNAVESSDVSPERRARWLPARRDPPEGGGSPRCLPQGRRAIETRRRNQDGPRRCCPQAARGGGPARGWPRVGRRPPKSHVTLAGIPAPPHLLPQDRENLRARKQDQRRRRRDLR